MLSRELSVASCYGWPVGDSRQSRCGAPSRHRCSSGIAPLKRPNRASTHEGPHFPPATAPGSDADPASARSWCADARCPAPASVHRQACGSARARAHSPRPSPARPCTGSRRTLRWHGARAVQIPRGLSRSRSRAHHCAAGGNRPAAASGRPTPDRQWARATPPTSRQSPRCTPLQRQGRASSFVTRTQAKTSRHKRAQSWVASARG